MAGFGCRVLAAGPYPNDDCRDAGASYLPLDDAVIRALKTGKIGYLGLDVYEEEADLFFEDLTAAASGEPLNQVTTDAVAG
jgi:D-lactate dehydrogenase